MKIENYDLTEMVIPGHFYTPGHITTLHTLLTQTVHWRDIALILEMNAHLKGLPSVTEFEKTTRKIREWYEASIQSISDYRETKEEEIDAFYYQAEKNFTYVRDEAQQRAIKLHSMSLYEKSYSEGGLQDLYDYIRDAVESAQKTYWKSSNGAKALVQRLRSRLNKTTKRDTRDVNRIYRSDILAVLEWSHKSS